MLSYIRVYVKNKDDIPTVVKICNRFYQNKRIVYLNGDVCRDGLFVEIECGIFL